MDDLFACTASVIYVEKKASSEGPDSNQVIREGKRRAQVRTNRFPCRNLLVIPDARDVLKPTCTRGNERSFGNGQSSWDTSALLVVI